MMQVHLTSYSVSQVSKILAEILSVDGHNFLVETITPFYSYGNQSVEGNKKEFLECQCLIELEVYLNILL